MFVEKLMTGFVFLHLSLLFFPPDTPTFEPFMNLRCATQDLRQLPFADSYEHFIFLRSPGGMRVQFAFQNPSLCLTSNASLVLSQWHTPLLSPRLDSTRFERFWWEEGFTVTWLLLQPLSIFRSSKGRRGCMALNASDKLATFGFIHFQQPSWGESVREILRFRERNEIGITGCQTEHLLCSYPKFVFVFCGCLKLCSPNSLKLV